jgi:alpha-glucuronidase
MKTHLSKKGSGYNAWLGLLDTGFVKNNPYASLFNSIYVSSSDSLLETAVKELSDIIMSIAGRSPQLVTKPEPAGTVAIELVGDEPVRGSLVSEEERKMLKAEGYLIKHCHYSEGSCLLIAGKSPAGVLYGVFALLRLLKCGTFDDKTYILDNPAVSLRMLNHWDNMDGSIERGYAGNSIFFENNNPVSDLSRVRDYARLMASIGLNGIVLNNVNVHHTETRLITKEFLPQVAKFADLFRQYGIKTYLSINYSSPMELGCLETSDPLDENVQAWWMEKADEIYSFIPDFGGFMVKADSEFRPGPFTYGRDHSQGANMLAAALKPHGGLVIWRCFVYDCQQDWRDRVTDRANAAYDNFMPLDGCFADNVLLQIKNGPMDFQVREPVSPLFGGLKKSNIMIEFQITQEYTGQQRHLCYLAPIWKETFDFDTFRDGKGSTVGKILTDAPKDGVLSGIAAVSNIGNDPNWTGHDLAQANLYSYGRLAWNPGLSCQEITKEWVAQTFGNNPYVLDTVTSMLMDSHSIYESYTAPLGIGWMVNPGHHYGPSPDGYEYSSWGTYHRADTKGIGVDRSVRTGTGYAGRYLKPNSEMYETPETCPEELLLFFHRIPYEYRLKSGSTLIQYIYDSHFEGAERAAGLVERWNSLREFIEPQCFARVLKKLHEQAAHACEWRDVINSYFWRKSGIPDEKGRTIY